MVTYSPLTIGPLIFGLRTLFTELKYLQSETMLIRYGHHRVTNIWPVLTRWQR